MLGCLRPYKLPASVQCGLCRHDIAHVHCFDMAMIHVLQSRPGEDHLKTHNLLNITVLLKHAEHQCVESYEILLYACVICCNAGKCSHSSSSETGPRCEKTINRRGEYKLKNARQLQDDSNFTYTEGSGKKLTMSLKDILNLLYAGICFAYTPAGGILKEGKKGINMDR